MKPLPAGAWDLHVHAAPSLFDRWGDAWDLTELCRKEGVEGFVLKSHHGSSVGAAAILDAHFPNVRVLGGLVLNHFVGGLNPYAVDASLSLGARVVWLPTIHAAEHGKRLGKLGGFGFLPSRAKLTPSEGLSILEGEGKLARPMRDILDRMNGEPVVLATGHISKDEIFVLHKYIAEQGLKIRLLLTHVFFTVPNLTPAELQQLQAPWTWFEVAFATISPLVKFKTAAQIAQGIKGVPGANWIMTSDSGQKKNPPAPKALEEFGAALMGNGISEEEIDAMARRRPKELLS